MKSLTYTIKEALRLTVDDDPYAYHPTNKNDLRKIIINKIKEEGPNISLNEIDLSKLINKENLVALFENLPIESIDISSWNISGVKSLAHMFNGCENLKEVKLFYEGTESLESAAYMFNNCSSLEKVEYLQQWNPKNLKIIEGMFKNCKNLTDIGDITKWSKYNEAQFESIQYMFANCENLNIQIDWTLNDSCNTYNYNKKAPNVIIAKP